PPALDALIDASGGLVGTLIRLCFIAAEYAGDAGRGAIDLPSAERAIQETRGVFKRMLSREHKEALRGIVGGEEPLNDEVLRDLLYMGFLLEYENSEPWYAVHPIVRPLIED